MLCSLLIKHVHGMNIKNLYADENDLSFMSVPITSITTLAFSIVNHSHRPKTFYKHIIIS